MAYVKYINENTISYANKKRLDLNDKQIFNPTENDFLSNGYLPLVEEDYPYDAEDYIAEYQTINGKIYQTWVENAS